MPERECLTLTELSRECPVGLGAVNASFSHGRGREKNNKNDYLSLSLGAGMLFFRKVVIPHQS
jgi:hypothetical protein